VRAVRRRVEAEQVAGGPAEGGGRVAPLGEEALPVLDRLLPATGPDVVGAVGFKGLEDPERFSKARKCELSELSELSTTLFSLNSLFSHPSASRTARRKVAR
jgi:hypothetical protein